MKRGPVFISCLLVIFSLILGAIPGEIGLTAAPLVPVCQIQGSGLTSPRVGQAVRTQGVVSADFDAASAKGTRNGRVKAPTLIRTRTSQPFLTRAA